jgi:hypothetical protein
VLADHAAFATPVARTVWRGRDDGPLAGRIRGPRTGRSLCRAGRWQDAGVNGAESADQNGLKPGGGPAEALTAVIRKNIIVPGRLINIVV